MSPLPPAARPRGEGGWESEERAGSAFSPLLLPPSLSLSRGLIFQINACINALSRRDPLLTPNNVGRVTIMTYLTVSLVTMPPPRSSRAPSSSLHIPGVIIVALNATSAGRTARDTKEIRVVNFDKFYERSRSTVKKGQLIAASACRRAGGHKVSRISFFVVVRLIIATHFHVSSG